MSKQAEIKFTIDLNEHHVPEKITWESTDGQQEKSECRSAIISIWDDKKNSTLRIDLWDKDMTVEEMRKHVCETILTLGDTIKKSTDDEKLATKIHNFGRELSADLANEAENNS